MVDSKLRVVNGRSGYNLQNSSCICETIRNLVTKLVESQQEWFPIWVWKKFDAGRFTRNSRTFELILVIDLWD